MLTCRRAASTLSVGGRGIFEDSDIVDVYSQLEGIFCRPGSNTSKAIDSLAQPSDLGQATLNMAHGINADGLRAAHGALRGPKLGNAEVSFSWWVPPTIFERFKKRDLKGLLDTQKFPVRQRVVKIPFRVSASWVRGFGGVLGFV